MVHSSALHGHQCKRPYERFISVHGTQNQFFHIPDMGQVNMIFGVEKGIYTKIRG